MTLIEITNEAMIWQSGSLLNKSYEFITDVYFRVGDRYFVMDVRGMRVFGCTERTVIYN